MRANIITAVFCSILVTSCTLGQHTETKDLGEGAVLSLTMQPYPPRVGDSTEMYVTLRYQRTAGTGCRVQYRTYLKKDGAEDKAWVDIPEQSRSGIYKTRTAIFGDEGEWRFEFNLDCGERFERRGVMFDFPVSVQTSANSQ